MSTEDAIEALTQDTGQERTARSENARRREARELLLDSATAAAQSIVNLAMHGDNEKIRFDACKYLLERSLGPASKSHGRTDTDPIQTLIDEVMDNTETTIG